MALPSGYRELEYLQATGTQYINSGVGITNGALKADMQLSWQDVITEQGMGFSPSRGYYFEIYNGYYNVGQLGDICSAVIDRIDNVTFIKTTSTVSLSVNGISSPVYNYGNIGSNYGIFSMYATSLSFASKCKLYSCKIYDGLNNLLRNFIPALRESDNKPGLYDQLNDVFYTNAGSGEFSYPKYNVTLSIDPAGTGTVSGGGQYNVYSNATIIATPNAGYNFVNWTKPDGTVISTNSSYTFEVVEDVSYVAHFIQTYTVTLSADPSTKGTVSGGGTYSKDSSVTVVATPGTGYAFTNWTKNGVVVSTNASYAFTLTENVTLVAHFITPCKLEIDVDGVGTVTGSGIYDEGTSVTVVATPGSTSETNYILNGWYKDSVSKLNLLSRDKSYTLTLSSDVKLVAKFVKFDLKATAVPGANAGLGAIDLDWSSVDTDSEGLYVYKGYSSSDNGAHWSPISMANFSTTNKLKVLQIYPVSSASNQLNQWMTTNGYGKGLIDVSSVSQSNFNSNPNSYLKDASGKYKYDVLFFGTWDSNGNQDISTAGVTAVTDWINKGKGVIIGHDTIFYTYHSGFRQLAPLFNIIYDGGTTGSGTQIKIRKKGLFTAYPWEIGEIGTILNVPNTHMSYQNAIDINEIWVNFANAGDSVQNFYMVSHNNTAMVQTGHSSGSATADEQKLIANLLFYMYQMSSVIKLRDNGAMDITGPDAPTIGMNETSPGVYVFDLKTKDNGTTWKHYIEAYDALNATKKIGTSNTTTTEVLSGLYGYRYLYDNNAGTVLTKTSGTLTSGEVPLSFSYNYVHICAVDNAGNISTTSTLNTVKRTITYNANGGTDAPPQGFKIPTITAKISSSIPKRDAHIFIGWSTSATSTIVAYKPGDDYTTEAAITLYAVWVRFPCDSSPVAGGYVIENKKLAAADVRAVPNQRYSYVNWHVLDYIPIDYIQSTGTQYIDTGIIPNDTTNIECSVQTTTNGTQYIFGSASDTSEGVVSYSVAQQSSDNCLIFDMPKLADRVASNVLGTNKNKIEVKNKKFIINDTLFGSGGNLTSNSSNGYIFAYNRSVLMYGALKLYYFKIWQDSLLVRNFIPVCRVDTGEVGLYDLVTNMFYKNQGTGKFIGGGVK